MSDPAQTADQPEPTARSVVSIAPLTLQVPGRKVPLEVRVSAPVDSSDLPVIVLSHGHGPSNHLSSLYGYGPLANNWAARGFLVIQPTHLDSMTLGLRDAQDPEAPLFWRSRAQDISSVLDHLDEIEAALPDTVRGVDRDRVAVAGHSMGGHTASLILGTRLSDPDTGHVVDLADPRVTAGLILAGVGRGGEALTDDASANYPCFRTTDFTQMNAPALVVAGDEDVSGHLTVAGPAWHTDPYHLAPGPKVLLTLAEAGHGLGGVSGYDAAETTDESPDRVDLVCHLTAAYLRTQLGIDGTAWAAAHREFERLDHHVGHIQSKS